VNPGFTATVRDPSTHPQITADYTATANDVSPIRRQQQPEEIAWACAVLCAERSAAITGTVLHVDGGAKMIG
jgi:3-oxoacyl-[acyl-carrier protein] reductase